MYWAIFWATFSQTHLVTLSTILAMYNSSLVGRNFLNLFQYIKKKSWVTGKNKERNLLLLLIVGGAVCQVLGPILENSKSTKKFWDIFLSSYLPIHAPKRKIASENYVEIIF
jgi:hypothetical protein